MISRFLGSYVGIAAVIGFCVGWLALGLGETRLTLALSVLALTFSQLILRDTDKMVERQNQKLDAIVHGTDADDSVADDTP